MFTRKWLTKSFIMFLTILTMSLATGFPIHANATNNSIHSSVIAPTSQSPAQLLEEFEWSSIPAIFSEQETRQNGLIQVFDVAQGKVILSVNNSPTFQQEASKWLTDITSLAPEVQPDMKAKYIARVPLQPPQNVQVGQSQIKAAVVFLFYYEEENKEPLLLVFDEVNKPYFFHIHENVKPFFEKLGLPH